MTEILDIDITEKKQKYAIADKGTRFLNYFIDRIIAQILVVLVIAIIEEIEFVLALNDRGEEDPFIVFTFLSVVTVYLGYYTLMEFYLGKTIGKLVSKTEVVKLDGSRPSFLNCLGRSLCRIIPFNTISFLFAQRGFHDTISQTYVVKRKE